MRRGKCETTGKGAACPLKASGYCIEASMALISHTIIKTSIKFTKGILNSFAQSGLMLLRAKHLPRMPFPAALAVYHSVLWQPINKEKNQLCLSGWRVCRHDLPLLLNSHRACTAIMGHLIFFAVLPVVQPAQDN